MSKPDELRNKAFTIRWTGERYSVSVPRYSGGEVVPLADALAIIESESNILAKLARLERMVEYLLDHSYNLDQHWREHIKLDEGRR